MSILGGIFKIGSAIAGGIAGSSAARKQRKMLSQQEADNRSWFNRRYNELGTERADAQAALTAMRDAQRSRMQSARGASAVSGASGEAGAVEKASANKAIGDVVSGINAASDRRKNEIELQYKNKQGAIDNARIGLEQQRAQQISAAASQAASAGDFFGLGDLELKRSANKGAQGK